MSDLPFDFSETLDAFECPTDIEVYEKTGAYVDGYWTETKSEPRRLSCILLNVDERKLQIVAEGRNIDEAYSIMYPGYKEPLHIVHHQGSHVEGVQSYVIIDGFEYVVVNNPETRKNAAFHSYYALRFEEQENPVEEESENDGNGGNS